jgi:hypothetical protein
MDPPAGDALAPRAARCTLAARLGATSFALWLCLAENIQKQIITKNYQKSPKCRFLAKNHQNNPKKLIFTIFMLQITF